jgi:hypothetical protein
MSKGETRVAVTCARRHSDEELMTAFEHTDAPEDWKHAVHAQALQHRDTSARRPAPHVTTVTAECLLAWRSWRRSAGSVGALKELRFRRRALLVATIRILGFLATLWVKIRRLAPVSR